MSFVTFAAPDANALSAEAANLLLSALSDAALRSVPSAQRGALRADLMRQMLIHSV